jgi:hypothetical protein
MSSKGTKLDNVLRAGKFRDASPVYSAYFCSVNRPVDATVATIYQTSGRNSRGHSEGRMSGHGWGRICVLSLTQLGDTLLAI